MYVNVNGNKLTKNNNDRYSSLADFESCISKTEDIVENMQFVWQGEDYDEFFNKMSNFIVNLNNLKKSIFSYDEFVKGYVDTLNKLDDVYKNKKINLK